LVNSPAIIRTTHYIVFILLLGYSCASFKDETSSISNQRTSFVSKHVGDSFDIHINLPAGYETLQESYPVVYYTDANLKSGKKLRAAIAAFNKEQPLKAIFIGVGHFSNYRVLRRRDFITPFIKDSNDSLVSDEKNFGQSENFYLFMKEELIPYVEKNYRITSNRSYIGHSLGGLFAFYCLFRKERLFNNIVS
jgi:predicted alpha/beta superfamily hydrolase